MNIADVLTDNPRTGIVTGLGFDDYKAITAINCSSIVEMDKSPLHFIDAWRNGDWADTESMIWGRAVHIAAFEPRIFGARVKAADGVRSAKKKAEAKEGGYELLKPGDKQFCYGTALKAAINLSLCKELQPFIKAGNGELSIFTEEMGMQVKLRLDWLSSSIPSIVDLKTTRNIDDRAFSRDFYKLHYDIKLGLYQRWTAKEMNGEVLPVHLVLMENSAPFDCSMFPLYESKAVPIDQAILDRGCEKGLLLIEKIRQCIDSGEWPGVASGTLDLHVPSWEMDPDEEPEMKWKD